MLVAKIWDSQLILNIGGSFFATLDAVPLIFISDSSIFFRRFVGLSSGCNSQHLSIA